MVELGANRRISLLPRRLDIELQSNGTWRETLQFDTDLTGWAGRFQIRSPDRQKLFVSAASGQPSAQGSELTPLNANGQLWLWTVLNSDLEAIPALDLWDKPSAVYDLVLIDPAGTPTPVLAGSFIVRQGVTAL